MGSSERGNEPSGFLKACQYLDQLSAYCTQWKLQLDIGKIVSVPKHHIMIKYAVVEVKLHEFLTSVLRG
jgi:hypothetical protein